MKAVVLDDHGGVDVLAIREVPEPVPGPEEVLVGVVGTALNRADLLQRMGLYPGPAAAHEIPGLEFAGRVVAAGDRTSATVGQAVMGIVGGGGYAESLVTHERMLLEVPEDIPLGDAAAIPEVFITAFDALVVQGGLTSGRTALVHAGASGVGTAAIQIARAIGARVVVTASADKVEACRELGANLAVDYRSEEFADAVRSFTDGAGADVILDVVGGDYLASNLSCVATNGRIIQVGLLRGGRSEIDLGALLARRASITGTTLRARPLEEKIAVTRRFAAEMLPLLAEGRMRPVIDSRYPLTEVAEAHRRMEANANVGKILLDVAAG